MDTGKYLTSIFDRWNKDRIRFVVLRNYANLPHNVGNDLDVLIDPRHIHDAEAALCDEVRRCGGVIHHRAEFSPISLFFYDEKSMKQLHVDLFRDLSWRGFHLLDTEGVLNRALQLNDFFIPSAEDEAYINLITRLVFGGYVREKYKDAIHQTFTEKPEASRQLLTTNLGSYGTWLWDKANRKQWEEINASVGRARSALIIRSLLRRPGQTLRTLIRDIYRLSRRWVRYPGLSIVLIGPDGCGKTSVGTDLTKRLAGTFYEECTSYLHWKPRLIKKMANASDPHGTPCTDPHGKPPRNPLMNIIYFLAHSLEIPPAWLLRVRTRLFRNMLVMIDRYYYDFMADSRRYRMLVSQKWAWFMYRFMPKPDLVFCLTAPTAVIQARKSEVSAEETERQRLEYEKVARRLAYGHVIDTNRPLSEVVDDVEKTVLEYLSIRYEEHLY